MSFSESTVEQATLDWLAELQYAVLHGPDIAPGEQAAERASFGDVVLVERLAAAIARINPKIPAEAREEALRKALRAETPSLIENNRRFHQLLIDGIDVEFAGAGGRMIHDKSGRSATSATLR